MKSVIRILVAAAMIGATCQTPAWSLGLAARFGEVVVENAQIGRTYNLRETLKIPFGVENRSTVAVEVEVQIQIPTESELNPEYVAIPDPTWVRAMPERITIGPNARGFFDLLLSIPDDPSLNGKHFQAKIRAQTVGTGLFGLAIENKLRFSIGPGPETLEEERRQKAMARLDFDISPRTIYLNDIPLGEPYSAREQDRRIRVANYSRDPLPLRLNSEAWDARLYKPAGYEAIPDPSWIRFETAEREIAAEAISVFDVVLDIPDDEQYRGKRYAALIRTGLITGFWLDAPVLLYFTTK